LSRRWLFSIQSLKSTLCALRTCCVYTCRNIQILQCTNVQCIRHYIYKIAKCVWEYPVVCTSAQIFKYSHVHMCNDSCIHVSRLSYILDILKVLGVNSCMYTSEMNSYHIYHISLRYSVWIHICIHPRWINTAHLSNLSHLRYWVYIRIFFSKNMNSHRVP